MMKIKYINKGTGNRIGDTIYLNKNLKRHPRLHEAILEHEKKHSSDFKLKDILHDLDNKEIKSVRGEFYWFVLTNPSSWVNFFPVMKIEKRFYVDLSVLVIWLFFISLWGFILWII